MSALPSLPACLPHARHSHTSHRYRQFARPHSHTQPRQRLLVPASWTLVRGGSGTTLYATDLAALGEGTFLRKAGQ